MKELVEQLTKTGYLKTPRIIEAFLKVDRKDFVPEEFTSFAYEDEALPTMLGQTISQPATVAFMLELLQPQEGDIVMDVGAGSCWQTTMLAYVVGRDPSTSSGREGKVYAIERLCPLLEWGRKNAEKYGFTNVAYLCRDATKGLPEHAPFDKIIAAAAGHAMIQAWQDQLNIGGRIVMPIEDSVWLYTKKSATEFEKEEHPGFAFVPLVEDQD